MDLFKRLNQKYKKVIATVLIGTIVLSNISVSALAKDKNSYDVILHSKTGCILSTNQESASKGDVVTIDVEYDATFDFEGVELVGKETGTNIEYENTSHSMWFEMPEESVIATPIGFDISSEVNIKEINKAQTTFSLNNTDEGFDNLGDYILSNANAEYMNVGNIATPVAPLSTMQTYAKESDFPVGITDYTITNLYSESVINGETPFIMNSTVSTYLFELDEDSDYYVAFVDATKFSSNISLVDFEYARSNVYGETVYGCKFDEDTGLVYVPKILYTDLEDTKDNEQYVRMQLLYIYSESATELNIPVTVTGDGLIDGIYASGMTTLDIKDFVTTIKIAKPGTELPIDTSILINGIPKYDKDSYVYDIDTGVLIVKEPSMGITSLAVFVDESSSVSTYALSSTGSDWNTVSNLVLKASKLTAGDTFTFDNQMFRAITSGEGYDNVGNTYAPLASSDYVLQDSTMATVVQKIYNATSMDHSIYTYTTSTTLLNSIWYANSGTSTSSEWYEFGFQKSTGTTAQGNTIEFIGSGIIPLYCVHGALENATRVEDLVTSSTTGHTRWRLELRGMIVSTDSSSNYAIIALSHQGIDSQSGLGYIRIEVEPSTGYVSLKKSSSNTSITDGNNAYSLAGAAYGVYTTKTGANNNTTSTKVGTLTTDTSGNSNTIELDEGTYYVKELVAPYGYQLDPEVYEVTVTSGDTTVLSVTDDPYYDPIGMVVTKVDADTGEAVATGNGELSGAQFTIKYYSTIGNITGLTPTRTWVFETDEDGYARYSDLYKVSGDTLYYNDGIPYLPLGTITIQETKAPTGYLVDPTIYTRVIELDATLDSVRVDNVPEIAEEVIRGGVSIEKRDSETLENKANEYTTFDGVEFTIYSENVQEVMVEGTLYSKGEAVKTLVVENGIAASSESLLPYGDYSVQETKVPEGYLGTDEVKYFSISDESTMVELHDEAAFYNDVKRGDIDLIKIEETTMQRMEGIPFQITSVTTGESHIIVTDVNGYASTHSDWNPHSQNTNRGETSEDGVWFGEVDALDEIKGALPYGVYIIEELPCTNNANHDIFEPFTVTISRDNYTVGLGTITNYSNATVITIDTIANDSVTASHMGLINEEITIQDDVMLSGLTPGESYRIEGILMNKKTMTPFYTLPMEEVESIELKYPTVQVTMGEEVSTSYTFVANNYWEMHTLDFTFKGSDITEVTDIVVFEYVYVEDELVAEHTDFNDTDQTVSYANTSIGTKASAPQYYEVGDVAEVIDMVMYENVIPDTKYTVEGILMDRETEEPFEINGDIVTSTLEFVPTEEEGEVELNFPFEITEDMGDLNLVVFETMYNEEGYQVAEHTDINDEDQTVLIKAMDIDIPKTGDYSNVMWLITLLISSFTVGIFAFKRRKMSVDNY